MVHKEREQGRERGKNGLGKMLEDDLEHTLGHRAETKGPLFRCPTCRNECSPRAAMCPKCGEPLLGDDLKKLDTQFSAWGTTEEDKTGKK